MPGFALLKHTLGDSAHYDLMLQRGQILKTWSIDVPLGQPGAHGIAKARFDHPVRFLTYEGPLSEANGAVTAVDRGQYEPLQWRAGAEVYIRLSGSALRGHLRLSHREGETWDLAYVAEPAPGTARPDGEQEESPDLMRVGEVARRSGFSREVVNSYAMFGLIRETERTAAGHRLFGPEVLQRLRMIGLLKRRGYTLRDIREIFLKNR